MTWESIALIVKDVFIAVLDRLPRKAIVLINDDSGSSNYWHIGSEGGRPVLQVVGNFMVTNVKEHPVALAKAVLKGIKGSQGHALIHVKNVNSNCYGSYDIPSRARTRVSVFFTIYPIKMPKSNETIKLNVGIVDQFGKKYWIKNVSFRFS